MVGMGRTGSIRRETEETRVRVRVDLDGSGVADVETGLPFFDHLLEQLAVHGGLDLEVRAEGDLEVDDHHLVEDVGICLGRALDEALGDRRGIRRMAWSAVPMDGSLVLCALDLSGRAYFRVSGFRPSRPGIGEPPLSLENVPHFWRSLCEHSGTTMHVEFRAWDNDHHAVEAMFKAVARALREAVEVVGESVPSTKGRLRRG